MELITIGSGYAKLHSIDFCTAVIAFHAHSHSHSKREVTSSETTSIPLGA